MGLLVLASVIVVASIVWLEQPRGSAACTSTGTVLYEQAYVDESGTCRSLSEFQAPLTIINVWASWCPFCVEELPDFARIAAEFPEVPVVVINRAEPVTQAQAFLETLELNDSLQVLFDLDDLFYRSIGGFGMPETVFVASDGTILRHKRGAMSLEEMRDVIGALRAGQE